MATDKRITIHPTMRADRMIEAIRAGAGRFDMVDKQYPSEYERESVRLFTLRDGDNDTGALMIRARVRALWSYDEENSKEARSVFIDCNQHSLGIRTDDEESIKRSDRCFATFNGSTVAFTENVSLEVAPDGTITGARVNGRASVTRTDSLKQMNVKTNDYAQSLALALAFRFADNFLECFENARIRELVDKLLSREKEHSSALQALADARARLERWRALPSERERETVFAMLAKQREDEARELERIERWRAERAARDLEAR